MRKKNASIKILEKCQNNKNKNGTKNVSQFCHGKRSKKVFFSDRLERWKSSACGVKNMKIQFSVISRQHDITWSNVRFKTLSFVEGERVVLVFQIVLSAFTFYNIIILYNIL